MPQFKHDCRHCQFKGNGYYKGQTVDWYTCATSSGQTVIARYGDEGPQYASSVIGETVEPCRLVLAALAQGLELEQREKDLLLRQLLTRYRQAQGPQFWVDCFALECEDKPSLGPADWLSVRPYSDGTVPHSQGNSN